MGSGHWEGGGVWQYSVYAYNVDYYWKYRRIGEQKNDESIIK